MRALVNNSKIRYTINEFIMGFAAVFALVFFLLIAPPLFPQEQPAAAPPSVSAADEARQKEIDRLEMELRVSTLLELTEWCRDLGLSEAGTQAELVNRIRQALLLPAPSAAEDDARIITIESARVTEYFRVEAVDEDYARLSGGVTVSLKDKTSVYKISAREILYNRSRNILSASGGVEYEKTSGDTRESFKGESFIVNLDTWAGSFIDSISERSVAGADIAYKFTGEMISQNGEEVSVLRNARITNAKNDEPYWSLNASRLWLLPGTDWALFNAVLKVGEIPVLWVPAFFWPSDEFVFHPVMGTRTREGAFFQTTTYIWGMSKGDAGKESSISKIMGSGSDMEKVREGLFLRTTGRKAKSPDNKIWSVSFDGYSRLGFYLGTDVSLPAKDKLSAMTFSGGLAFSRNIYYYNGVYTPFINYVDGNDLDREWNNSRLPFLPFDLPLRYRFITSGSFTIPVLSLKWTFPLYSDANINSDFYLNRSETFDWFSLIKGDSTETSSNTSSIGNYSWNITASSNIPVQKISPYISSLSISNLSTNLEFQSRAISGAEALALGQVDKLSYSTSAGNFSFYAPSKWTIYSFSGSISGTPLTIGVRAPLTEKQEESKVFSQFGVPRSPWTDETGNSENAPPSENPLYNFSPGTLTQTFTAVKDNGLRFAVDYRFTPTSATEINFRTGAFNSREDIDFTNIKTRQTRLRGDGALIFSLSEPNNQLFSTSFSFNGSAEMQQSEYNFADPDNPSANENQEKEQLKRSNYAQTIFNTTYSYSTTLKPLYRNDILSGSNISHSLSGRLVRSEFDARNYNDALDNPVWNIKRGEWKREDITSHRLSLNLSAVFLGQTQTFTVSADLPPLYQNYQASLTFRAWISETQLSGSYREIVIPGQPSGIENPDTQMKPQPITFSETLTFAQGKSLRQTLSYDPDPEHNYWTQAVTTLTLGVLNAQYTMTRNKKWFYTGTEWSQNGVEDNFNPVSFNLTYNPTFKEDKLFNNLISYNIGISTSLFLDLQRYNLSRFTFTFNARVSVSRFIDFNLAFQSENTSLYRYLQNIPGFEIEGVRVPGESNIFLDLLDSFDLGNMEKRRNSGFKMRSLTLGITHHLGDWDASLDVRVVPYRDTSDPNPANHKYKFTNEISFGVRWIPISEIKTDLTYNERTNQWTQK